MMCYPVNTAVRTLFVLNNVGTTQKTDNLSWRSSAMRFTYGPVNFHLFSQVFREAKHIKTHVWIPNLTVINL